MSESSDQQVRGSSSTQEGISAGRLRDTHIYSFSPPSFRATHRT